MSFRLGSWVGMGERDAAAIIDTRTGELWPVPQARYSWGAWSYGDIALVTPSNAFIARQKMSCSPVTPPAAPARPCQPGLRS